jgi:ATP-dependent exoDNAse (exonuclease V) beta subunit
VLGIEPAGYPELWTWNDREDERERVRLWYVATTRARDILVLPRHSVKLPDKSWANIVDLGLNQLVRLDAAKLGKPTIPAPDRTANAQTRAIFTAEAGRIAQATQKVDWVRPSRIEIEADTPSSLPPLFESEDDAQQVAEISAPSVAGSSQRGIILHKLMEEVLTGETPTGVGDLHWRAVELLAQLGIEPKNDPKSGISPAELAETIERTLNLPEIAQLRERLVPEHTIFGHATSPVGEILISGIADAVAPDSEGGIEAIVDWKSDVDPSRSTITH